MQERKQVQSNQVISGLLWTFGERISAQLVSLIVSVVLARILDPDHYGVISIVMVFITLLNVFVSSGFGSSLVQKKDAEDVDFNSAFWLSTVIAFFVYVILFFVSPLIANIYDMPIICPVIRVMGLRLIIAAGNNIQQAYYRRLMKFRTFFWATLFGTIFSGVLGVFFALRSFGVWALVIQYMSNVLIDTTVLFLIGGWRPRAIYSNESIKSIWNFGWKVLVTDLIFTFSSEAKNLLIGKVFGPADLAFYDHGRKYPNLLITNINAAITKVMLPSFSSVQDDSESLLSMLRRSVSVGVYCLAPLLVGFSMISENFVRIVLTEKWIQCVPYIKIFCFMYITRPLESACHQALLAKGCSGTVLKCIIAIDGCGFLFALIAIYVFKSVPFVAISSVLSTVISVVLFLILSRKHLSYRREMQVYDVLPTLLICIAMGGVVYAVGRLPLSSWGMLTSQVFCGMAAFIVLSWVFKLEPFLYILDVIKGFRKK